MAFKKSFTNKVENTGAGENWATAPSLILSATVFEDGLKSGLFAKLDAGSLDNLDGSASPAIAGVVINDVVNPVDNEGLFKISLNTAVSYLREGLVTVTAKAGEAAPAKFGDVFASNAGDANDGKATATGTDVATTAQFIRELKAPGAADGVWLVNIK